MKISIVTVCYNNTDTIKDTFESIRKQDYENIEYIVKDGGSTDGTVDIIKQNQDIIDSWDSSPDEGIYDAMNKGFKMATGDVFGILNADDILASEDVISTVANKFKTENIDACWGDLEYVKKDDLYSTVRKWKSSDYEVGKFELGWHPPHPTFYATRELYEQCGYFNTKFEIAADYELMLRFLEICNGKSVYIPKTMVKMRTGGKSNKGIANIIQANKEVYEAWKVNRLDGGKLAPFLKPLSKLIQYFK